MEERGILNHTMAHGVFVGPPCSGKNSLMERLLGKMPSNLSPSTGLLETIIQVQVVQMTATFAANVEESVWSIMDYDDEAIKLMVINIHSENECSGKTVPQTGAESEQYAQYEPVRRAQPRSTQQISGPKKLFAAGAYLFSKMFKGLRKGNMGASVQTQSNQAIKQSSPCEPSPQLLDSFIPPSEILKQALRNKGGLRALQQHFEKTWSLYLTNTGGQIEFQEVLPLVVSGPSIFFFTFRLDRKLDERYEIEYRLSDGTRSEPYKSTLTTIQGILQTLASIAAMGTFTYEDLHKRVIPLRPKVFLIGTHKDLLDDKIADDHIKKIDKQLKDVICSTKHYEDLVRFASQSQLIFTVNNFSESESDFKMIRSVVEVVVEQDGFEMASPSHWLIFSLAIRKYPSPVIRYDECFEIAKSCKITDKKEFDLALNFIHSKMGLIRYFPDEHLKNIVIVHPQFLFDKVTELIVGTFTFEKLAGNMYVINEFKRKGIVSVSDLESIGARNMSGITTFQFRKILESLRIAAPFKMKGEEKYFIPCVLAHADQPDITFTELPCAHGPTPPLLISFECGYCPKGVSGGVITYLMVNEMQSNFAWMLKPKNIFRDQVSFLVGPYDTIVLKILSTHLEVICIPGDLDQDDRKKCPLKEVCVEVRRAVEKGVREVTHDINYVQAHHSLSFSCKAPTCSGHHPAKIIYHNKNPSSLLCEKTDKRFKLPTGYEIWFNNKSNDDSSLSSKNIIMLVIKDSSPLSA